MDTKTSFESPDDHVDDIQCRTCLVLYSRNQVYSLDSKNLTVMDDGSEQTIAEIYHQCTQLLDEPEDQHPKWICQYCTEKMIEFYQFRKMCIDSYNTFKLSKGANFGNKRVKVELVNVSEDAVNDSIGIDIDVVIKEEDEVECDDIPINDKIECTSITAEGASKIKKINCQTIDDEQNMTLRKRRKKIEEKEPISKEANSEENKDDNQGNDGNDSDFNGFDAYDDDSSDESSVSDQMVYLILQSENNLNFKGFE